MERFPRLVTASVPGQEDRFYLIDRDLDFIPEVKELVDQKSNTRCSPNTIRGICVKLRWYYQFLNQQKLGILDVKASDLVDFSIWLGNPYRFGNEAPKKLSISTRNQILYAVANLYRFLVRRGHLTESPVFYEEITQTWGATVDGDLLAHTRRRGGRVVRRMELKIKEPKEKPKTVSPADFEEFVQRIHVGDSPNANPPGFRNRLILLILRESGLRIGELLGIRMEDLNFSNHAIYVRFRPDNENGSRAKAGYGRDRVVHLPPELFGLLDIYISEVWVSANYRSSYLWLVLKEEAVNQDGKSTFGTALTQSAANGMFRHYSKQSGIKIHPHMLRHTHATDLVRSYLKQGEPVDWKFISDRLGHASVVTTMKTYVHLTKEDNMTAYKLYLKKKGVADAERRQRKQAKP